MIKIWQKKITFSMVALVAAIGLLSFILVMERHLTLSAEPPKEVVFVANKILQSSHIISLENQLIYGFSLKSMKAKTIVTSAVLTLWNGEQEQIFPLVGVNEINQLRTFRFSGVSGKKVKSISINSYSPSLLEPSGLVSLIFYTRRNDGFDREDGELVQLSL